MIYDVLPGQYLDEVARRGVVVVLLHVDDAIYRRARRYLEQAEYRFSGKLFRFCCCCVKDGAEAAEVQAIKFPQYRFFANGSERSTHVGILTDEEVVQALYEITDESRG